MQSLYYAFILSSVSHCQTLTTITLLLHSFFLSRMTTFCNFQLTSSLLFKVNKLYQVNGLALYVVQDVSVHSHSVVTYVYSFVGLLVSDSIGGGNIFWPCRSELILRDILSMWRMCFHQEKSSPIMRSCI